MPIDIEAMYKKSAMRTTATSATVLGLGMISPNLAFSNMMTTFALSGIVGYQASCMTAIWLGGGRKNPRTERHRLEAKGMRVWGSG